MSFLTVYSEASMRNDYLEYISIRQTVKNSEYFSTAVYVLDFFFLMYSQALDWTDLQLKWQKDAIIVFI